MQQIQSKIVKRIGILLFWLAIWQMVSWLMGSSVLLPGPWETMKVWWGQLGQLTFWKTVILSSLRIGCGLGLGVLAGGGLGGLGFRFSWVRELVSPVMVLLKSVPVASFTVLLLIWWGSAGLSVAVVFTVVLPFVYVSVLEGLQSADTKLLEMAKVFRVPWRNRFFYIYEPALGPFLDSCFGVILGMSWKSGVAAEVIGMPAWSIGERMYLTKVYLQTGELFAWTGTVVLLSFLFERVGLWALHILGKWKPNCLAPSVIHSKDTVVLEQLEKHFGDCQALSQVSMRLEPGKIYCLTAPSGAGKTTLLRILAGLERPDRWESMRLEPGTGRTVACSMVFQEDRLLEEESAAVNIMFAVGSGRREEIRAQLEQLLPGENLEKPCAQLSGGMRRRVCLVRAMMASGQMVLLDEPFAGLDPGNRERAARYIQEQQGQKILVISGHEEGEIGKLRRTKL